MTGNPVADDPGVGQTTQYKGRYQGLASRSYSDFGGVPSLNFQSMPRARWEGGAHVVRAATTQL